MDEAPISKSHTNPKLLEVFINFKILESIYKRNLSYKGQSDIFSMICYQHHLNP